MSKLFQIRPKIAVLIFLALIILFFFFFVGVSFIFSNPFIERYSTTICFSGLYLPFSLFFAYVGFAINKNDKNPDRHKIIIRYLFSDLLFLCCYIASTSFFDLNSNKPNDYFYLQLSFSTIAGICLIYMIHYWVEGFSINYNKRPKKIWDYLTYFIYISLFPFGVYFIQKQIIAISDTNKKRKN